MTESQQPNPFSREASEPTDGFSANPNAGSATPPTYRPTGGESPDQYAGDWPSYPADDPYLRPEADPYAMPGESYGNPNANSTYAGPEVGFAPQPTPPYGDFGHNYGQSAGYDSTLYEANPYRPAFGAVSPYGAAPEVRPTQQHPQATLALILGILGTVLGFFCIVARSGGNRWHRRRAARSERDRRGSGALHRPLASRRWDCHRHYRGIDLHPGDGVDRARGSRWHCEHRLLARLRSRGGGLSAI